MRILTFAPFNSHTDEIFEDLKILKVRDVIKMHQLRLVFDFLHGRLPSDLISLFRLSSDVHQNQVLTSSVNSLLYVPAVGTTTYGVDSIRYHCPKLWNELFRSGSIQVKDAREKNCRIRLSKIKNIYNFTNALKRHFIYQYSVEDDFLWY